ncbi:MAG: hypothetical protein ABII82_07270 [Verrucomicrobiota bacterium]
MPSLFRSLALVLTTLALAAVLRAEDPIIAKARSNIGSEAALNGLRSVHYTGHLEVVGQDADGQDTPVKVGIEIIFEKPYRQRIVATSPQKIEVTALDDYDAWQREQDPADANNWRMTLLSPDQIKRLRANTWENLSFYRGIEERGGRTEDLGTATVDGVKCRKLAFIHDDNIVFHRYFDAKTGKLILTETESGSTIRERGELKAGGLNFPNKIVTRNKLPDGSEREIVVTFDSVKVNEDFPEEIFAMPLLGTGN